MGTLIAPLGGESSSRAHWKPSIDELRQHHTFGSPFRLRCLGKSNPIDHVVWESYVVFLHEEGLILFLFLANDQLFQLVVVKINVTEHSMRKAMNEEAHLTLHVHERHVWSNIGKEYSWWTNHSEEARRVTPENVPRLVTVSFDMGWQQCSGVNKYKSNSGHTFCIKGYSKNILDYCIKSKVCNTCDYAARPLASAEPRVCPKNHQLGNSKSIGSDASRVKMVIKAVDNYQVFYTTMVFDDNSTIRA